MLKLLYVLKIKKELKQKYKELFKNLKKDRFLVEFDSSENLFSITVTYKTKFFGKTDCNLKLFEFHLNFEDIEDEDTINEEIDKFMRFLKILNRRTSSGLINLKNLGSYERKRTVENTLCILSSTSDKVKYKEDKIIKLSQGVVKINGIFDEYMINSGFAVNTDNLEIVDI